mmetsp:Transcript_30112/g.70137  ORF Transcript_30112/g.70137 Transcript_30112/m.70137 type:complete len:224 (+) Transcript_30112:151-822(+)
MRPPVGTKEPSTHSRSTARTCSQSKDITASRRVASLTRGTLFTRSIHCSSTPSSSGSAASSSSSSVVSASDVSPSPSSSLSPSSSSSPSPSPSAPGSPTRCLILPRMPGSFELVARCAGFFSSIGVESRLTPAHSCGCSLLSNGDLAPLLAGLPEARDDECLPDAADDEPGLPFARARPRADVARSSTCAACGMASPSCSSSKTRCSASSEGAPPFFFLVFRP